MENLMSDAVQDVKPMSHDKKNAEIFLSLLNHIKENIPLFKWEYIGDLFTGYGPIKVTVSLKGFSVEEAFRKNNMEFRAGSDIGLLLADDLIKLYREIELYYNTVSANNLLAKLEAIPVQN
jgi:hypothetical protein